jgi:hypothetical protein
MSNTKRKRDRDSVERALPRLPRLSERQAKQPAQPKLVDPAHFRDRPYVSGRIRAERAAARQEEVQRLQREAHSPEMATLQARFQEMKLLLLEQQEKLELLDRTPEGFHKEFIRYRIEGYTREVNTDCAWERGLAYAEEFLGDMQKAWEEIPVQIANAYQWQYERSREGIEEAMREGRNPWKVLAHLERLEQGIDEGFVSRAEFVALQNEYARYCRRYAKAKRHAARNADGRPRGRLSMLREAQLYLPCRWWLTIDQPDYTDHADKWHHQDERERKRRRPQRMKRRGHRNGKT